VFSPDRGHLHHILLDAGISHRRVVIGLYMLCCILCSTALVIVLVRNRKIGYFLVASSICGAVWWGLSVKTEIRKIGSMFSSRISQWYLGNDEKD
jgi:hypothetical protein